MRQTPNDNLLVWRQKHPPPQHKVIPANLEASDETLEREAGTDKNKV